MNKQKIVNHLCCQHLSIFIHIMFMSIKYVYYGMVYIDNSVLFLSLYKINCVYIVPGILKYAFIQVYRNTKLYTYTHIQSHI